MIIDNDPNIPIGWRDHFNYRNFDGTKSTWSEWIELKAGQHYYIEGHYVERNGDDHYTVAVEIEKDDAELHHHVMKEIQEISAVPDVQHELTRVTITNPDNENYKLIFKKPDLTNYASKAIPGRATAN